MNSISPNLYAVDSAQLAEELQHVDITSTMPWCGFTIITGVHIRDGLRPVTIIKGHGGSAMHMIALPGGA